MGVITVHQLLDNRGLQGQQRDALGHGPLKTCGGRKRRGGEVSPAGGDGRSTKAEVVWQIAGKRTQWLSQVVKHICNFVTGGKLRGSYVYSSITCVPYDFCR